MPQIIDAVAPPTDKPLVEAEQSNIGFKARPDFSLGWTPSPILQEANQISATKHYDDNAEKAKNIVASQSPTATNEDRLKAATALKAYSSPGNGKDDFAGSHETRLADVFSSKTIGDIITGFTGGSDVREIGRNGEGVPVVTVYNTRGDIRRYEWQDGTKVSPEELKQLGPVASTRDISAERASLFKSQGLSAQAISQATANDWANTISAASNTGTLTVDPQAGIDINTRIKGLATELLPNSVNPATRAFIAGIGTLTSNKAQQASIAKSALDKFSSGEATSKDFNDYARSNGGLLGTLTYTEGKGLTNANGTKVDSSQIKELSAQIAASNSSDSKITANAQNLSNLAQQLAADGKIENLDKIQELIGLTAQSSLISKRFDQVGIPGFKGAPNVAHTVTDSFSLAHTNADYALAQAEAAKAYGQHIRDTAERLGYRTPPLGSVAAEFAHSDTANQIRAKRTESALGFLKSSKDVMEKLNAATVPAELSKQILGVPVAPPTVTTPSVPTARSEPKPPAGSAAPNPAKPKSRLDELFPRTK